MKMLPPAPTVSSPPVGGNAGRLAKPDRWRSVLDATSLSKSLLLVSVLVAGLVACSSAPPPPDWQMGAKGSLERATEAGLRGDAAIEAVEFARARAEVASTGRLDWVARVVLVRCAGQVAALDFQPCGAFEALAPDAADAERAYARYLAGAALATDVPLLPKVHQPLALVRGAAGDAALAAIEDPLSRLVAAGVLMRRGEATPGTVQQAVDTASAMGWRKPLLAWLGVAQARARAAGADAEVARLQRRIDLVAPPAR